jgi:hypothetical protein
MMTKQQFELVAEIVKSIRNLSQRTVTAFKAVELLSKENPRFNKTIFLKACDV